MTAFGTMLKKEFRELLPGAGIVLAATSIAFVYGFWRQPPIEQAVYSGWGLLESTLVTVTLLSCCASAAGLGFMQFFGETRGDLWAFLVHRPVGRGTLFAAKAAAGVAVYLLATTIPLLAATWWSAQPANITAPFDARFMLAHATNIAAGLVFYFAGALIARRQARWFGGRLLPLGLAIGAGGVAAGAPWFWGALALILATAAINALAAAGAFLSHGADRPQPWYTRAALGLSLLAGIAAVVTFSAGIVASLLQPRHDYRNTFVAFLADGTAVLQVHERYAGPRYTDLDGQPLDIVPGTAGREVHMAHLTVETQVLQQNYRECTSYYLMMSHEWRERMWFLQRATRRLLLYDLRSRHIVGALGENGFHARPEVATPIPVLVRHYWTTSLMHGEDRVFMIEPEARELRTLFTAPSGEVILAAGTFRVGDDPYGGVAVATERNVYMRQQEAGPFVALARPNFEVGTIQVGHVVDQATFVVRHAPPGFNWGLAQPQPQRVVQYVSAEGQTLRTVELPALRFYEKLTPTSSVEEAFSVLLPPLLPLVGLIGEQIGRGPGPVSTDVVWVLSLSLLGGVISAVLAYTRTHRASMSHTGRIGWTTFSFLSGIAGYLLLLAMHTVPARITCHACRKRRWVCRERCEHCGAPHPQPAALITEDQVAAPVPCPIGPNW
ncbi:MAG: hypothetical protein WD042_18320 [Phycisphaeraceae bacterium]